MEDVVRLSRPGRVWRLGLVLVLVLLFLLGTAVGDDPWWPFGPWRMFSTSTAPTGAVVSTLIEVESADRPGEWVPRPIDPWTVGLNRAEVEGRLDEIRAEPAMLGTLAASHARLRPREPRWTAVRVVFERHHILDGKPTGEVSRVLVASWRADGTTETTGSGG